MIIIFLDLGMIGVIWLFFMAVFGGEIEYLFDNLPNYINQVILILIILQIVKSLLNYLYVRKDHYVLEKKSLILVMLGNAFFDCARCFIIAITVCNWLSSYSSDNIFEMIFTALTFLIDVAIYGLIILASEWVYLWQVEALRDGKYTKYLTLGIMNAVALFFIIAFISQGALIRAFKKYFFYQI